MDDDTLKIYHAAIMAVWNFFREKSRTLQHTDLWWIEANKEAVKVAEKFKGTIAHKFADGIMAKIMYELQQIGRGNRDGLDK